MREKKKQILVNFDKCSGCCSCEVICSLQHFGVVNPRKSCIKVLRDLEKGNFFPIISGPSTDAEYHPESPIIFEGKRYGKCPSCLIGLIDQLTSPFFKEPKTGKRLQCNFCGMCVKFCDYGALSFMK